jgi:biotin carboxylase
VQKLAVIGASYLQKPLVLKAREMGFETHVFAWEDGAVCKEVADHFYPVSITEVDEICDICQRIKPQGIVSIGSDLATVTVNRVAEKLGLIGNSLECTEVTTNKFMMRERLKDSSIPCPKYWLAGKNGSDLDVKPKDFPLIVKPVDRSGSRGVSLVRDESELVEAIQAARERSFSAQVIIEQFIEGRELSVESISWQGRHYILQFTDKETTGAPHYIEKTHHQPAELSVSQKESLVRLTRKSLDCLGVQNGASHSEFKIMESGEMYLIEVGARMGGDCIGSDLVRLSTGYDFVRGVIEVAVGSFEEPVLSQPAHAGIHYVFPQPGTLREVLFASSPQVVHHEVLAEVGDAIAPISDSSQRPAYYIYQGKQRMPYDPSVLRLITKE